MASESTRKKMSERRKGVKKPLEVRMRMIQGWKERRAKMLGVSVDCVPPTRREVELMKNLCGKSVLHDEETLERTYRDTPENIEPKASSNAWMRKVDLREWVKKHGKIQLY